MIFIASAASAALSAEAAEAMKITAQDLQRLGVVDRVVEEPIGGAQRQPAVAIASLGAAIADELEGLASETPQALVAQRRSKFLTIGG